MYAGETWTLRKRDKNRLLAAEMKCYRRILKIRRQQKITNNEVRSRVGSTRNIIQLIMERKLNLLGHICRMDEQRLMKNVMFRMVDGTSLWGRPSREWLDDVKDWCNIDIHTLSRMAQDRLLWRHVLKSALYTDGHWTNGLMMMMMMSHNDISTKNTWTVQTSAIAKLVRAPDFGSGWFPKFSGDFLVQRYIYDKNFHKDPFTFLEMWAKLWNSAHLTMLNNYLKTRRSWSRNGYNVKFKNFLLVCVW